KDLKEAFAVAADAEINLTLDQDKVEEKDQKKFSANGKDVRYLLFSWLEEIPFILITEGFAIKRIEFEIKKNGEYKIEATAFGEPLDVKKHNFKVEIKAPTFYDMEIRQNNGVYMRFLLDL
ncbi:MAG: archease, partial [Candidatus Nitrosomaritimum yanchengensis]